MVEEADTPEQVSAVYDKVARWQRENGDRPIRINGVPFASAQDHSWNKMDREHKVAVASSKLPQKLEWLSWADVEHIIEIFPESAPYMPTSEEAKRIFDWKSSQDALLARKYRIGGDFIELNEGSTKERDNHQDRINKEFERMLQAAGEKGVLEQMFNYPAENFDKFGALPNAVEWIVPYAVAVHRELLAQEKTPGSNAGHVQQRWVYSKALELFAGNPQMEDDFIAWGMKVYQESTVSAIVAQLLGNYKGDME